MAQDMPCAVGHAVYAVGDGLVLEAGGDHHYGGVIVVLHTTADGHVFKAVYGHMHPASGIKKGVRVKAGQVVGRVNGAAHLHFGIHPGRAYPPDNNPYRGHTYNSKITYGWVDPVKYLRANPRLLPYKAPVLPIVATVETAGQATVLGTLDGSVYWSVGAGDDRALFRRSILGDTATSPVEEAPGELDETRFAASVATTTFTLADRLPSLTLAVSTAAPAWKRPLTVSGRLTNAAGAPFVGAKVIVETSPDGDAWTQRGVALSGLTGAYSLNLVPSARVLVRARFAAPATFLPVHSVSATVAPKPSLSAPTYPSSAEPGHRFTVRGTLTPHHAAGSTTVSIVVQIRVASAWVDYRTLTATCSGTGSASTYAATVTLPAGSYRMRAGVAADAQHAATTGSWSTLVLR